MDQNRNVKGTYEFFFENWIKIENMLLRSASKTPIAKMDFSKVKWINAHEKSFPTRAKKTENDISTILVSSMLRCWIWKVKWLWMIDQPGANNYNNYNDFNHFKIISIYRGCPVALFDYFFTCSAICTSKGLSVVMLPALISVNKSKKVFRSFHR